MMGVWSNEVSIVTYSGDTGTGTTHIYLTDVPDMFGGDCDFEMTVDYQRQ